MDFNSQAPIDMPTVPSSWAPRNNLQVVCPQFAFPTPRSSISSTTSYSSSTSSSSSQEFPQFSNCISDSSSQHHSSPSPYTSTNLPYTPTPQVKSEPTVEFGGYQMEPKSGTFESSSVDDVFPPTTSPVRFQSSLRVPTIPSQSLNIGHTSVHPNVPYHSTHYPNGPVPIDPFLSSDGYTDYMSTQVKEEDVSPPFSPSASVAYSEGYIRPTSIYQGTYSSDPQYYYGEYCPQNDQDGSPLSPSDSHQPYYVDPSSSGVSLHGQSSLGYSASDGLRRRALRVNEGVGVPDRSPKASPDDEMDELFEGENSAELDKWDPNDIRNVKAKSLKDLVDGPQGPGTRPGYPYSVMIRFAILGHPEKRMTLGEIYEAIQERFPYYKTCESKGWKNSIRHNLSLNRCFVKQPRSILDPGKGSYWTVDEREEPVTSRARARKEMEARKRAQQKRTNVDRSVIIGSLRNRNADELLQVPTHLLRQRQVSHGLQTPTTFHVRSTGRSNPRAY